ncbi:MAG: PorV/PorQ family protein [Bacteroidetes bacterium]|nr:PorV/PorQ family protein [Bacteroidota bacterium]MBS1738964.1 PorV/PorQ family protein [Bacteroidota bacterium]
MKKIIANASIVACAVVLAVPVFAGNKDRTGQSGATELLINPWAQSTGLFGMNSSYVRGVESMKNNIAGLAYVQNTEVGLAHSIYLRGSNVSVNNLGMAQKVGNAGVIGFNIMSMSFGNIPITTTEDPEGKNSGSYNPQFLTFQLGYAKEFSNSIRAGLGATFVSEQITNVKATGACFEGGVQYVTGKRDNFHFGVTLRNVGTNMRFSGQGFAFDAQMPGNTTSQQFSTQTPTEKFEMPTYLNFGASYDFYLDEKRLQNEDEKPKHRASVMLNFTSNSFNNDYIGGGVEYAFKETFMIRGAYRWEQGIGSTNSSTFYTGIAAGASIQKAIGERGPILAIDYSYRPTARPNNGVHVFSLRFMTRPKSKKSAEE